MEEGDSPGHVLDARRVPSSSSAATANQDEEEEEEEEDAETTKVAVAARAALQRMSFMVASCSDWPSILSIRREFEMMMTTILMRKEDGYGIQRLNCPKFVSKIGG
mmetsp:Transcript_23974/g.52179  ORF Transcript_23974/g.52179 Transcript_23974/m.52179 type:complete len:106 (-) Transcript_23974:99-416(-)